jgi:glycosyltransferase involved in cell wall biosynthesis
VFEQDGQEGPALKLSIIIANYNHRDFVGGAIESALTVDWPHKEVIVVDDASTDDSRSVIDGFRGRVTAFFRPKSNQLGAHIFGVEQCTGDVIIFLDADDLLEAEVMQEVAKVWRPGISQVQYRMNVINAAGTQSGTAIPQFPPEDDPKKLRGHYLRTLAYTTPPGSGSAYSRYFVTRAYATPLPPTIRYSDSLLHSLAPILGDVVTIRKPLARYRIHDADDGSSGSLASVNLAAVSRWMWKRHESLKLYPRNMTCEFRRIPYVATCTTYKIDSRLIQPNLLLILSQGIQRPALSIVSSPH